MHFHKATFNKHQTEGPLFRTSLPSLHSPHDSQSSLLVSSELPICSSLEAFGLTNPHLIQLLQPPFRKVTLVSESLSEISLQFRNRKMYSINGSYYYNIIH